ncbi:MAG: hypothetical protein Q8L36_00455 [bacterium]|nr:hypothetical protein [bacterium]
MKDVEGWSLISNRNRSKKASSNFSLIAARDKKTPATPMHLRC